MLRKKEKGTIVKQEEEYHKNYQQLQAQVALLPAGNKATFNIGNCPATDT